MTNVGQFIYNNIGKLNTLNNKLVVKIWLMDIKENKLFYGLSCKLKNHRQMDAVSIFKHNFLVFNMKII